jgi:hypothetical protein
VGITDALNKKAVIADCLNILIVQRASFDVAG